MKHFFLACLMGMALGSRAQVIDQHSPRVLAVSLLAYFQNNNSLEGEWYLQPVLPSDTATGKIPVLNFSTGKKRFSGNTGCNSMSGTFTLANDSLVFGPQLITTRMACQGYNEKAFLANLMLTNHFKIENGTLLLMNNNTVLSKWIRSPKKTTVEKT
jgi:heat shock protein HslJ